MKQESQTSTDNRSANLRKRREYDPDELEEIEQPLKKVSRTIPSVQSK